jgi:NADH-quinone oxidoreductase subunit G
MEYLLINHPLDCPVCDQAGECILQDYSYEYGRSQSRFEEDKVKNPKKDVGEQIYLYADRCIMCTRCVRFTREVSGTSELYVDGRGNKEEIDIFPGKPCNNKLAGNVVDLCPVGALLDKDFLFKQRVWLLKSAPSISPCRQRRREHLLEYNEGVVYRIKPRYNADVNTGGSATTRAIPTKSSMTRSGSQRSRRAVRRADRHDLQGLEHADAASCKRWSPPTARQLVCDALADDGLRRGVAAGQRRSARSIRRRCWFSARCPTPAPTRFSRTRMTGKQTFVIKAEKVPNAAGIRRVIEMLGGPTATFDEFVAGDAPELGKLKGGWIVGGYLSTGSARLPELLERASASCRIFCPAA